MSSTPAIMRSGLAATLTCSVAQLETRPFQISWSDDDFEYRVDHPVNNHTVNQVDNTNIIISYLIVPALQTIEERTYYCIIRFLHYYLPIIRNKIEFKIFEAGQYS